MFSVLLYFPLPQGLIYFLKFDFKLVFATFESMVESLTLIFKVISDVLLDFSFDVNKILCTVIGLCLHF